MINYIYNISISYPNHGIALGQPIPESGTSTPMKELNSLVTQLNSQAEVARMAKIKNIEDDRKAHRSCIEINKNNL